MRVEISNGYVDILDVAPRKVTKGYRNALVKGCNLDFNIRTGEVGGQTVMPVENIEAAKELSVIGMVTRVVIHGVDVTDKQKFIMEDITDDDFGKVALACQKIIDGDDDEESKEEKKTE